jgi:hypothetical protein
MNKFISLFFLFSSVAFAKFEMQGEFSLDGRKFQDDGIAQSVDQSFAFGSKLMTKYKGDFIDTVFGGFARVDSDDNDRNIIRLEDAYAKVSLDPKGSYRLIGGFRVYNWTSMEAFHPVDVINSRNFDSDIEKLEKVGELGLSLEMDFFDGEIDLYYFPKYEDAHYPGKKSRLGAGVDLSKAVWVDENTGNEWGTQYGIRATQTFAGADLSAHFLSHMDRNHPIVGTSTYIQTPTTIIPLALPVTPHHFRKDQYGGTITYDLGEGFLFKFEGAYYDYHDEISLYTVRGLRKAEDHSQVATGLEYGFEDRFGGSSNLFLEIQKVLGLEARKRYEITAFQNDLMLGWRYAFNDVMGSEFFIGFFADLERSREFFYSTYFARRLSDSWKFKVGLRVFQIDQKGSSPIGLELFDHDSHATAALIYYF